MTLSRRRRHRAAPALVCWVLMAAACGGSARPAVTPVPRAHDPVAQLQQDLSALLADPVLHRATWAVAIHSLATRDPLYELNARKLLMPASAMKVVTLAVAADRLGWDYSYETTLVGGGPIEAGTLNGDLIVVGGGDPSIDDWDGAATRLFASWADQLKALGIHSVAGRIVGDDSAFEDDGLGAGWAWDDLSASFATAVGALQFNQNTARVMITPASHAGEVATAVVVPHGSGLSLRADVVTAAAGSAAAILTRRLPGSSTLDVRGTVPAGVLPLYRNVSVDNPTLYFATALRSALISAGIVVRGEAADIDAIDDPPVRGGGVRLVTHRSPPLSILATTMMMNSQNLYAETVLKTLATTAGSGVPATAEAARVATRGVLETWGVSQADVLVADGSGLSRYNLATAGALVTVLSRVAADERLRGWFELSLPVAGQEGTLSKRMKGTAAEGNARAKTGSFSNARALAGYVRTADGEPLAFAILANNYGTAPDVVERTADAVVTRLAEFSRR